MKKAIIYGVTGQDGSYLSELLLSKEYTVYGITRRTSVDNTIRINHLSNKNNFNLVQGDVTDTSSIYRLLNEVQPDEVYNLAAQSHVGTSFEQPLLTWNVTGQGCLNILKVIRQMRNRHSSIKRVRQKCLRISITSTIIVRNIKMRKPVRASISIRYC